MFNLSFYKKFLFFIMLIYSSFAFCAEADTSSTDGADKPAARVYDELPSQVDGHYKELDKHKAEISPQGNTLLKSIGTYIESYKRTQRSCGRAQASASWYCAEKSAPKLQEILNTLNTASSTINMSGIMDACSTLGQISGLVNTGLTAYTASCAAVRATCNAYCGSLKTTLEKLKAIDVTQITCINQSSTNCGTITTEQGNLGTAIKTIEQKELNNSSDEISIAGKAKACSYDYGNMVTSATMGMIQMVNSMKQAKSCTDSADGTGADKCLDAEVAATDRECICRFYPRTAGCDSALSATSASNESSTLTSSAIDKKKETDIGALAGADENSISPVTNSASGSGMAGAPTGGGGGFGGGGGGGSGSGGEGAGGAGGSPLNSKIINGFSGGGGGGFGGRSSASTDAYRAYLPGGKKDPALNVAGQELWKKEVTGQGGKSNWDKVRDRYRDNRPTLIGN